MAPGIDIALQIALLLTLGVICQWLAWRMRLPAILPLLLTGLLLGPALGLLNPNELLGDLLFPMVSLGVAIILFEGSLTLRFSDVRSVARVIRNLTSIGVAVTWGVMSAAAHFIVGWDWKLSLLFGALVTVTGPTVVMPMLRSIQPTERIANILRWEGILVDPIGAVLAVLIFEMLLTGQQSESWMEFVKVIVLGSVWGVAGGVVLGQVLKRHVIPDYLENYAGLAFVLLVFTASNSLGRESGLIAVTMMGLVMANMKGLDVESLLSFKEHLTVVLISMLFILLAARVDVEQVASIGVASLLVLAVALFVARPLAVALSSIGSSLSWREGVLLSWVAPRGIVAAAISALFALRLEGEVEGAALIVPLTFVIIIGTVVVHSLTAGALASRLGLSSRGEQGVLITASNKVALLLGEALLANGIKVLVADTRRERLHEARMKDLSTFYGNPLSEHADRHMDLTGYNWLWALSLNPEANAMVCDRLRPEFGPKRVFSVQLAGPDESDRRAGLATGLRGTALFGNGVTWSKLANLAGKGAVTRSTPLTEEYDFEALCADQAGEAVNLFALDEQGCLQVFTPEDGFEPGPGWTVVSLGMENEQTQP
ncbi:MAG: cation:proton antiporter [Lysobacterales bacterium]